MLISRPLQARDDLTCGGILLLLENTAVQDPLLSDCCKKFLSVILLEIVDKLNKNFLHCDFRKTHAG